MGQALDERNQQRLPPCHWRYQVRPRTLRCYRRTCAVGVCLQEIIQARSRHWLFAYILDQM
ncbi:MAG TPA: hypothetical protein VKB53_01110 [Gammaproteobacteria bacterium]|nr:hypothetical protein [Gammaproteobacteria bacterium]